MKIRTLWLCSVALALVSLYSVQAYVTRLHEGFTLGIGKNALVLAQDHYPALTWGNFKLMGDVGLKVSLKDSTGVDEAPMGKTVKYTNFSYSQIQPGLYLVKTPQARVFVVTDPFQPDRLNPAVAVSFDSDWVVLQRSSLLPKSWPEPEHGWVVLGPQVSQSLKAQSLQTRKPVIRPESGGTLWLQKSNESDWRLVRP